MAGQIIIARGSLYNELPGTNYSTLKHMGRSPLHFLHASANARRATPAMLRGSVVHTSVLEPERIREDYAVYEGAIRRGKEWDAFEAANRGREIIKAGELAEAQRIAAAVHSHAKAAKYLRGGSPEVTLIWDDLETGIDCKGRVDWLTTVYRPTLVGLKTTKDAGLWGFQRQVARLAYHVQWAFYADGYERITGDKPDVVEIVVETEPPHDVVIYRVPDDVLAAGRELYRGWLRMLQECTENDDWPGQSEEEIEISLPAWAATGDETEAELVIGGERVAI